MVKEALDMIEITPCRGCGRHLIHHRVANLAVRLELEPITGQEAVGEIMAQRTLWMVDQGKVRPARPGEPGPLREHRCTAAGALRTPSPVPAPQPTPREPSAGQQTPSSGPRTAYSSARSAAIRDSENPRCPDCGLIMHDGDYVSVELGQVMLWAIHINQCGE